MKMKINIISESKKAVSKEISKLVKKGTPQKQAVAIALDMERRGKLEEDSLDNGDEERSDTWNKWNRIISRTSKSFVLGSDLENVVKRISSDKFLLNRVQSASDEGYIDKNHAEMIILLSLKENPEHERVKNLLLSKENEAIEALISYFNILGLEFAMILKGRAYKMAGESSRKIMRNALEARFENYVLYGRGPAEQRDEFIKKAQKYGWSHKENLPIMYKVRENKKYKIKII